MADISSRTSRCVYLASLLFILSFLCRYFLISKGPYHADGLYLAIQAERILESGQLQYLHGTGHPCVAVLGAIFLGIARFFSVNDSVFAVNMMSVIFGALIVPLNYLFVTRLVDEETAVISSILLSLSPIPWAISIFGNTHCPTVAFMLLGLIFLHHYFNSKNFIALAAAGVSLGFMGACRLQDYAIMMIPILFWMCTSQKEIKSTVRVSGKVWASVALIGISLLVILLFYIPSMGNQQTALSLGRFIYQINVIRKSFLTLDGTALTLSSRYILTTLSYVGCAMVVFGIIPFYRKHRHLMGFFVLWTLIPFFFYGNLSITVPRFYIISVIPLLIIQSYALSWLIRKSIRMRLLAFAVLAAIVLLTTLKIYPILEFRHRNALLPEFYKWVSRKTGTEAVIIERNNSSFVKYYGKQSVEAPDITLISIKPKALEEFKGRIDSILNQGRPVYIAGTALYGFNPEFGFTDFMKTHYQLEFAGRNYVESWYPGCLTQAVGTVQLHRVFKKRIPD